MSTTFSALDERVRAFYFGAGDAERALFGWYHPPAAGREPRCAVVVCPPLGYEGICAYPALRTFAERLAAAGHPVLRFDFDGTGDSGGTDADPDRVSAWQASVGRAIEEVRALGGVSEVCLFGVRMGATLALLAAAERGDVERLVLFCPCTSGKAYVRELKAFRMLAEQSGELTARPRAEGDTSEESGGFLLTGDTVEALKRVDATKLTKRPAPHVLLVTRDDVPADEKVAGAFEALGAKTTVQALPGFGAMMVAPHKSVFPEVVCQTMLDWLDVPRTSAAPDGRRAIATSTAQKRGPVASGVHEETLRFGEGGAFFGVLTEPAVRDPRKPLIVFSNTAGNYRVGPNRMYVDTARKLATLGFSSVRIDVSGIGDSAIWKDEALNHPYGDRLVDDVRALIRQLRSEGRAERFAVAGLCSGAFVAYHTALADPAVTSVILINPQTFKWENGMSLEVNPLTRRDKAKYYQRRLFAKDAWMKLLRGGVDVRHALGSVGGRVVDTARSRVARMMANVPIPASRGSDVARAFDKLCARGVDVFVVFSANDPGIDNLHQKVGASMRSLEKRSNFTIVTIDGPDHSFTPIWAQVELDRAIVAHVVERFGG